MKQCCNTCSYNMNGVCTVLPGDWNNIIPANVADSYRCKEYVNNLSNTTSIKKLVEKLKEDNKLIGR